MTSNMPTVSVVLPIYNSEEYLLESISSILNQTFEDFELIIINDGSTDYSKDIILSSTDKRIKYYENENNQGLIKALNKGFHYAKGEYIARMDADDLCHKNRFEKQIEFFKYNPIVDILGTAQFIIGTDKIVKHKLSNDENKIMLLLQPVVGHSTVMIRKEILNRNKLYYDKHALYAEDYKLWVDASLNGMFICNIDECLCGYRIHEKQISNLQFVAQSYTAERIRINYAKYFFSKIVSGNETAYLSLIHGVKLTNESNLQETIENIYYKLLIENSRNCYFNKKLFELFLEQQFMIVNNI